MTGKKKSAKNSSRALNCALNIKNLPEQVTCCHGFQGADKRNCRSANNLFPKTEKNGDVAMSRNNAESFFIFFSA